MTWWSPRSGRRSRRRRERGRAGGRGRGCRAPARSASARRRQATRCCWHATDGRRWRCSSARPAEVDLVLSISSCPSSAGASWAAGWRGDPKSPPVLYMSGYTGEHIAKHGLLDPGAAFVQKPFAPGRAGPPGPPGARPRASSRDETSRRSALVSSTNPIAGTPCTVAFSSHSWLSRSCRSGRRPGSPTPRRRPSLSYSIDLNDRADDLFKVTLTVDGPGPGQRDLPVRLDGARDLPGDEHRTVRAQLRGARCCGEGGPGRAGLREPVEARPIPRECGPSATGSPRPGTPRSSRTRSISCAGPRSRRDHVLINPHAVIGYPSGLQAAPVRLRLIYPTGWKVGTALEREKDGTYLAESYDQLIDSPILLGRLTDAQHDGDRRAGRDLRLLEDRPDQGAAAAGRDGRHAGGGGAFPRPAAGQPVHVPLSLRGQVRRRVGAFAELGVRLPGIRIHRFAGPRISRTSPRTSSSTS